MRYCFLLTSLFLIGSFISQEIPEKISIKTNYDTLGIFDEDLLPPSFHAGNRNKVRALMPERTMAIYYAGTEKVRSNDVSYEFHQDPDFYYLTGLNEPNSVLLLFKEPTVFKEDTIQELLLLKKRNPQSETWVGKKLGVDGIKTGFLAYEKYSLASSIKRNNRRLIAVGSGFETRNTRSKESQKLLTWGLTNFDTIEIAKKGEKLLELDVWLGQNENVGVYSNYDIYKTIKKARLKNLEVKIIYDGPIEAPIKKNQVLAKLKIIYNQDLVDTYDLLSIKEVKKVNIFSRLMRSLNYLIWGDV